MIPVGIVFFLTIVSLSVLISTTEAKENEIAIKGYGQQFFWDYGYESEEFGELTSKVLVIPENEPVRLDLLSRDVLHAFWVPEFRVKQDLMPGRITELRFTPNRNTGPLPSKGRNRCNGR